MEDVLETVIRLTPKQMAERLRAEYGLECRAVMVPAQGMAFRAILKKRPRYKGKGASKFIASYLWYILCRWAAVSPGPFRGLVRIPSVSGEVLYLHVNDPLEATQRHLASALVDQWEKEADATGMFDALADGQPPREVYERFGIEPGLPGPGPDVERENEEYLASLEEDAGTGEEEEEEETPLDRAYRIYDEVHREIQKAQDEEDAKELIELARETCAPKP